MAVYAAINEIFVSLQGEGSKVGTPCVFVRFAGCSKQCEFCDTKKAQSTDNAIWMDAESIIKSIQNKTIGLDITQVIITGGEPFEQANALYTLIGALHSNGFNVAIETSGLPEGFFDDDLEDWNSVFNILDGFSTVWITLSPKANEPAPIFFERANEIKLLINTNTWAEDYLNYEFLRNIGMDKVVLQPIWNQAYNKVLSEDLKKCLDLSKELGLRVSFQMHKYINIP